MMFALLELVFKSFTGCVLLFMLTVCTTSSSRQPEQLIHSPRSVNLTDTFIQQKTDTVFTLLYRGSFSVPVIIKYPSHSFNKNILLLHGYNLPSIQWCEKTSFCKQALDSGYTLIIPDFGKTTYQYKIYTETIQKYRIYPTRQWMLDTLIPHLQKNFNLLLPDTASFVTGISTGGRGAVLLGADRPEIFRALASLSGDFDQTKMAGEPIYTGYYGPYQKFKSRWTNEDNPMQMISTWTIPCFLAHGKIDKVSPFQQTSVFSQTLKKKRPKIQQAVFFPAANGHDYVFWSLCTAPMLSFFYRVSR